MLGAMTTAERAALAYLAPRAEADHRTISEALGVAIGIARPHPSTRAVLARLRHRRLVVRVPTRRAWRITKAGRAAAGASQAVPAT